MRKTSPQLSTQPSGLVIHPTHRWLAASPDSLVYDPNDEIDPFGIVEFKNPYSQRLVTERRR